MDVHQLVRICIVFQPMKIYIIFKAMPVCFFFMFRLIRCCCYCYLYLAISSVTPNSGSTAGGTVLNIAGNYFSSSASYPLVVQIGGESCTILNSTTTTIQCQTSSAPSGSRNQYQG